MSWAPADNRGLVLRELLEHDDFGLELLTAHGKGMDRLLMGAHVVEDDEDPGRWLDCGWVVLTAGLLCRNDDDHRRLVRAIAERDAAALGFTVGWKGQTVPPVMIEEGERCELPIFAMPLETQNRDIVAFVGQARISRDILALRRTFSIQRYLLDSLHSDEPVATLVEHLVAVLQGSVFVLDPLGREIASQGNAPVSAIWEELSRRPAELQEFSEGRWSIVSTPVRNGPVIAYWLVVATPSMIVSQQVGKAAVETAAQMLSLISLGRRAALAEERALKSALLQEMLDDGLAPDSQEVRERLRTHGFEIGSGMQMMVMSPVAGSESSSADLLQLTEMLLANRRCPALLMEVDAEVVILVDGGGEASDLPAWLHEEATAHKIPIRIGVGRQVNGSTPLSESLMDARLALVARREQMTDGGTVSIGDLDPVGLALRLPGIESVAWRAVELLAPLEENGMLLETLKTFFEADCEVAETSRRLHLHANSVRYRLGQVEKLLSCRLGDPATTANVYVALQLRELGWPKDRDLPPGSAQLSPASQVEKT